MIQRIQLVVVDLCLIIYLAWSIATAAEIVTANYTSWQYIPWSANDWGGYTDDYVEQCVEVQVWICEERKPCIWPTSNALIDSATTRFDTGSYTGNQSMDCYCYAMMDLCVPPTTTERATTIVATNGETDAQETGATIVDVS
eukprot:938383_1